MAVVTFGATAPGKKGAVTFGAPAAPAAPSFLDYLKDVIGGSSTGAVKLGAETAMMPLTLARQGQDAQAKADEIYTAINGPQAAPDPNSFWNKPLLEAVGFSHDTADAAGDVGRGLSSGQDAARKFIDENTYQPTTMPGKIAEEGTQWMLPAAFPTRATRLMTGGARIGNWIADAVTHGALPWAAYEGANKFAGPEAGLLASLFAGAAGGAMRTAKTPEAIVRHQTAGYTPENWQAGADLRRRAEDVHHIDLSGAEALAQAVQDPKAPILKSLQVAEAHPSGSVVTAPFFRPRAGQIDTAVAAGLDQISPVPQTPEAIGPQVSRAATETVRDAERARSDATEPHYQAANAQTVAQDQLQGILTDIDAEIARDTTGAFSGPLQEFRNQIIAEQAQAGTAASRVPNARGIHSFTPATPPTPERPALDIENLDTARKLWRDRLNASPTAKDAVPNILRGKMTPFLDRIDALLEQNPDFLRGKEEHARMTHQVVEPTKAGPIGQMASAGTTEAIGNLLLPGAPTPATTRSVVDAITRVGARTGQMLPAIRQGLDSILSGVSKGTIGGERGSVGAKFARDIAGSPQLIGHLRAALGAAGAPGAAMQHLGDLVEVLQATGKRLSEGSPTAQRNVQLSELGTSPVSTALEAGATRSFGPLFNDFVKEHVLRGNVRRLAELTTGPVENMQGAAARAWRTLPGEVARRTGLSALTQYYLGDQGAQ